jgi:hypothetical protein
VVRIFGGKITGEGRNCLKAEATLRWRRSLSGPLNNRLGRDVSLVFIESDKAAEELLNFLELESGSTPDCELRIQFLRHHRSTSGQG